MQYLINYKATHDVTGEVIEGNAKEVAEKLRVVPGTVSKMALQGKKISGHWAVEKTNSQDESVYEWKYPQSLLQEWDRVTAPFKELSRRKRLV